MCSHLSVHALYVRVPVHMCACSICTCADKHNKMSDLQGNRLLQWLVNNGSCYCMVVTYQLYQL